MMGLTLRSQPVEFEMTKLSMCVSILLSSLVATGCATQEEKGDGGGAAKNSPTGKWEKGYEEAGRLHGHHCPGLAMGYRMAKEALAVIRASHPEGERLGAVVENNMCGTDALQWVTSCTFGKGNLVFRDWGKPVFTLYSVRTREGVRVVFHGKRVPQSARKDRDDFIIWILEAPREEMMSLIEVTMDEPDSPRTKASVNCGGCGEPVSISRIREIDGETLCIPCTGLMGEEEGK